MSIGKAEILNYFSACILMTIGTAAFFFARSFFTEKKNAAENRRILNILII